MNDSDDNRQRGLEEASAQDWLGANPDPDVLLSVPDLGVDKITLNVDDLQADIDLHARVLEAVEIHVGAQVTLGRVELEIENVHAKAMLKVKLEKVAQIVDRLMRTIDNNPEIITSLTQPVGRGVEELGRRAGEGVREIGKGTSGSQSSSSDSQGNESVNSRARDPSQVETKHDVTYDEVDKDTGEVRHQERRG
jgi:Sec-independent protein translocase protein TatA